MAHLSAETSNSIFKILGDWNDVLRFTSLNQNTPPAAKRKAGQKG
jgi:hypothetical protein